MDREEILNKANELISEKNFADAKTSIEEYLKETGDDSTEIQKTLGLCNVNLDKLSEAKENFEKVINSNDEDATSWFYLGIIYESLNNFEKSRIFYIFAT